MTRSEAAKLGGLARAAKLSAERKTEIARAAGQVGGRATVDRHGIGHMQTIGKRGFSALARKLGYVGGSRRGALRIIQARGGLPAPRDLSPGETAALYASVGLDQFTH